MINPITENEWEEYCPEKKCNIFFRELKFDIKDDRNLRAVENSTYVSGKKIRLLLGGKYYISYIYILNYILIPTCYNQDDVKKELKECNYLISFSDWKLEKIYSGRTLTINSFMRVYSKCTIGGKVRELLTKEEARWKISNSRTGYEIVFETLINENSCWWLDNNDKVGQIVLSYDEKQIPPYDEEYLLDKDNFIQFIINGCKNN